MTKVLETCLFRIKNDVKHTLPFMHRELTENLIWAENAGRSSIRVTINSATTEDFLLADLLLRDTVTPTHRHCRALILYTWLYTTDTTLH